MFDCFGVGVNLSPFSKSFISVLFNVRDDKFTIWTSACSVAGFAIGFCMGFGIGTKNSECQGFDKSPHFWSLCFGGLVVDIEGTCSLLDFYCTVIPVCFDFVFQQVLGLVDCLKVVVVGCCCKAVLFFIYFFLFIFIFVLFVLGLLYRAFLPMYVVPGVVD